MPAKYAPPEMCADRLIRRRPLEAILANDGSFVTLVHAPAGFGKTTLMLQACRLFEEKARRVVWCNARDCEITDIINTPTDSSTAITVFIDEFDSANNESLDRTLSELAAHPPDGLRFVVAARVLPAFACERLRLEGRLRILAASALCFDEEETERLLGAAEADPAIRELVAEAEGWPAAIHLAATLYERRDASYAPFRLASDWTTSIKDYWTQEVLHNLPEPLQRFLLDVSILESIRPELADALCDERCSAAYLHTLQTVYAVVDPADAQPGAFCIPSLYRKALLSCLAAEAPQRVAHLHRRAATWCERKGDVVAAIRHALAADDQDLAVEMIERAGGIRLAFRLGPAASRAILERLPRHLQLSNPRIAMLKAFQLLKDGEIGEARSLARIFAPSRITHSHRYNGIEFDQAILNLLFEADAGPLDESISTQVTAVGACVDPIVSAEIESYTVSAASYSYQQLGQLRRAAATQSRWCHLNTLLQWNYNQLYSAMQWGKIAVARGDLLAARESYEGVMQSAEQNYPTEHGLRLEIAVLLAEIDYLAGRPDQARKLIPDDFRDIEECNCWYDIRAVCYALNLRLIDPQGGAASLRSVYDGIMRHIVDHGLRGLGSLAAGEASVAAMRMGDLRAADTLLATIAEFDPQFPSVERTPTAWRIDDATMRAFGLRAYLAGDFARAAQIGLNWGRRAREEERLPSLIGALTLEGLAHAAAGLEAKSLLQIREALHHAQATGAIQPILDYSAFGVAGLLERLPSTDEAPGDYLAQVLAQLARTAGMQVSGLLGCFEGLSTREFSVLQGIQRGESNKLIARRLNISENTVKFHAKNLFRKLGISKRRDARTTPSIPAESLRDRG